MAEGATAREIEMVYRSRFTAFCSVANAIVHDREGARDAVQDAFAAVLRQRHQWRREGSLEAWVWRAVVNAALDQHRRSTARPAVPATNESPSQRAQDWDTECDGAAAEALATLPERQRLVLFLRYYADLSYAQIAEVLSLKTGSVAATIHQAQQSLKDKFEVVAGE